MFAHPSESHLESTGVPFRGLNVATIADLIVQNIRYISAGDVKKDHLQISRPFLCYLPSNQAKVTDA